MPTVARGASDAVAELDEMPVRFVLTQEERIARQSFSCDSCELPIKEGDVHLYTRQTDSDEVETLRSYVDCYDRAYLVWSQSTVSNERFPR